MSDYAHSPTTRAVLTSLVPVICPPEAHALADAIVAHVALTLGAMPPMLRAGLAAALVAYDLGAVPRYGRRARALPPAAAERYFAAWERMPAPLAHAIKQLVSLACYEQPAMMERVGYRPGPWIEEVRAKRLTVYRDDAEAQAAQVLAPDPLRPGVHVGRRADRVRPIARAMRGGG